MNLADDRTTAELRPYARISRPYRRITRVFTPVRAYFTRILLWRDARLPREGEMVMDVDPYPDEFSIHPFHRSERWKALVSWATERP